VNERTVSYGTDGRRGDLVPVLSVLVAVLGVLMMICSPLSALRITNPPMPAEVAAMEADERPPPPKPRTVDVVSIVLFFVLGTLGVVGGLLGLLRLEWGRRAMILFSGATLAYIVLAVGYRLTGGLTDLYASIPDDAPKGAALGSFLVWTLIPLGLMAFLLVSTLRHMLRPEVAVTFRGVKFG
jgi:hypothetical protein